jgi:integrase/recombinase XerD
VEPESTVARVDSTASAHFIVGGYLARYPARTRQVYGYHLKQWWQWCEAHRLDPMAVQRGHIEAWARHLTEERGLKTSTVAGKINCIAGLYKFAFLDGFIPVDPAVHVRRPHVEFISSTKGLTRSEAADVLKAAAKDGPMTHTVILLLMMNGLRVGECLAINIEHLGFERGYRTLFLPHRKGGKVGRLGLAIPTAWAIESILNGRTDGPLLLGHNGERLHVAALRRTIVKLCRDAGITKRITPHSFRHTFVTMALDAGIPERDIMASTGHLTPTMIGYYDRNRGAIERNATYAVAAFIGVAA